MPKYKIHLDDQELANYEPPEPSDNLLPGMLPRVWEISFSGTHTYEVGSLRSCIDRYRQWGDHHWYVHCRFCGNHGAYIDIDHVWVCDVCGYEHEPHPEFVM